MHTGVKVESVALQLDILYIMILSKIGFTKAKYMCICVYVCLCNGFNVTEKGWPFIPVYTSYSSSPLASVSMSDVSHLVPI